MNNNNPKGDVGLDSKKQDSQVEETELPVTEEQPQEELPQEEPVQEAPSEPSELEKLQEENRQLNERYMRALADYENFRRRSAKEKENIYPDAKAAAVKEFRPIADNFARALTFECADTEFKKGVEMIHTSLLSVFEKLGVEPFGQPGETFDPSLHNAVMHVEDESVGENTIVEVFQDGYRMGDRILRYAMVKVAN